MTKTANFVEETRFGNWFLKTAVWKRSVLVRALNDLKEMIPTASLVERPRVIDVGCGFGHSFAELAQRFQPSTIVGLDADPGLNERAGDEARACHCEVQLIEANAAQTGLADGEFDVVFCHQTFHHIVAQEAAMTEFYRILKPGGMLLFAESTKYYIQTPQIRFLFRHPMEVQRTADEYITMVRAVGFAVPDSRISLPYLWWSRPDIGFLEWMGRRVPTERNETLVNLVAIKPN
nr:class I SAM-dependent methyltransferase [Rhodoferax sp.]